MTDLLDISDELSIFMYVIVVKKGHDMMNQNVSSFSYLRINTSIMSLPSLFQ